MVEDILRLNQKVQYLSSNENKLSKRIQVTIWKL